ncbi:MAG: ABC transporter ATP-binding protein [Bacteroidales bacterium]|nr:ABC transporter ATP-binding protein [Bacteroidales bacterium]MDD4669850.1 ABC transporter ATP-binding protein [Bacteroidales bacterium]
MDTFKRILAYAKPYGRYWPGYLLLSICSVIFGIINYALIGPLLTVLFESDTIATTIAKPEFSFTVDYAKNIFTYLLSSIIGNDGIIKGLAFVALTLVAACLLSNICRYLSQRILVSMKTKLMKNIRRDLFAKIASLHIGYFNGRRKGDILSSISNDVNEVQNSVASSFHIIFRDPLLVIGFLAMLFYMSPRLTLVSLIALPFSALVITRITRKLRSGSVMTQTLMGRILSQFEEAISGSRIIKAFNAQQYVENSFDKNNEAHRKISRSIFNRQELASPTSEFLGITIAAVVLFYGGWLNINGNLGMTWPEFIVYIGFYWRVLEPAKAISNAYANIQRGLVSGNRIFEILDVESEIKEKEHPVRLSSFDNSIEFKNVSFSYTGEPVLKNIDLVIPKGKMVAVVGPSGAGKSTMADLLPRFWDVTGGSILLDGTDIRDYKLEDLISLMGIVTQESILFNDTVYNNITFGMENVSQDEVIMAAKIANADEFISQMEEGYQTNIGDRGAKLSGGQRQRIAIARAVLKNPPILILDEATSALDTESERLVQDALTKLMKNRTSLVIAHRLSTIRYADSIVVLQNGAIVERGNHDSLIEKHGLYSHLCELQAFS